MLPCSKHIMYNSFSPMHSTIICAHFILHTETDLWLSKAVMAVITRKYIESKFCDMELCHAQIKGKEKLSILYEKIDFNGSDKAQKLDMVIPRNQHIHFQQGEDDFATFLDKVVEVLKAKGLGAQQAH